MHKKLVIILPLFFVLFLMSCKPQKKTLAKEQKQKDSVINNPVIRHIRTADPSAHVWKDGKVWMYTSLDMENATIHNSMDGYRAFSSTEMVY